jgi:hypothetical protein
MSVPSGSLRRLGWVLCALLAVPAAAQKAGEPLASGPWGGEGLLLLVGADRTSAELNCAHGQTDSRVFFAEDRQFQAAGWIVEEGGATQEERKPAVFIGRLRRDVLTVRVRYGSDSKEMGPFELRQGGNARVSKCQ